MPLGINGGGPAPGYRDAISGDPVNVGNSGYSWISTVSDINSLYLRCLATGLNSSSTTYRTHGFQLRCLSE
ncbi:hypothetical protein [uncultured Rikenella sp.]|uniref:hypothetical protein n=1 Tax=uncultured Rikenella sp. TaxID=368003 RepID=UPI0025CD7D76|nr:hypothetical protein [uncultured Rikenella sp.]